MFTIGSHGELEEKFPALLLGWCAVGRFSGSLSFNISRVKRDFYFLNGKIIATASEQPAEGVVAALVRLGKLTNDNYRAIYQTVQESGAVPEQVAQNKFGIMGGQLREAQVMASRLLVKQLAVNFASGEYTCHAGCKPPAGSVMIELDPLYDLISALCDNMDETAARNWLLTHDFYLRTRSSSWSVIRPLVVSVMPRLKKPLDIPVRELPAGLASKYMDLLGISPRAILILLSCTAIAPSEPQEDDGEIERPASPEVQATRDRIKEEYERIKELDFFALLGLAEDAKEADIRSAYLERAQEWHSDRFGEVDLGSAAKALQAINARINEAKETLLDAKKNETYRFVLERTRKGLPTDVEVILKAEDNFKKAELCIEQSKYQMALPLLEEAVQLNKGEPEFWLNLALCQVAVHGQEAYDEAQHSLDTAVEIDKKMEFKALVIKGRIELMLEKYKEAQNIFDKVLQTEPNNEIAKKSLRLIGNRLTRQAAKEADKPKSFKELLTGKK